MGWDSNVFKIATEINAPGNLVGRSIEIIASDSNGTGEGGDITLTAGMASSSSPQVQSGNVEINAGAAAGRLVWGGDILIEGGSNSGDYAFGSPNAGGKVTITTGTPRGETNDTALDAESLDLIGGTGGKITANSKTAGKGSSIVINAGTGGEATGSSSTGGEGGDIVLTVGDGGTGTSVNGSDGTIQLWGDTRAYTSLSVGVTATGFTFPTTDGSADQILVTDGSGNVDWADITSFSDTTTTALSGVQTSIDSVAISGADKAIWELVVKETATPTNRYSSTIAAIHDGATAIDFTEYAILETGTPPTVTTAVDISGADMRILITTDIDTDVILSRRDI